MAAEPVGRHAADADLDALRAERDALARRCAEAEQQVADLTAELTAAREELQRSEEQSSSLSLFEGGENNGVHVAGNGTDARSISLILGATAIVSGMVVVLAFLNDNLFSVFGIFMVLLTAALAWGAAATRVEPVSVYLSRGVVHVEQGESKYRFDLAHADTKVEQLGQPGDEGWRITFARRHTGPFSVDATMVDPHAFTTEVRKHRPEL